MEYLFRCQKCGKEFSVEQKMDGPHEAEHCGEKAQRVYRPIPAFFEFKAGFDIGLGKNFETQRARDAYCAEHGYRRIKS